MSEKENIRGIVMFKDREDNWKIAFPIPIECKHSTCAVLFGVKNNIGIKSMVNIRCAPKDYQISKHIIENDPDLLAQFDKQSSLDNATVFINKYYKKVTWFNYFDVMRYDWNAKFYNKQTGLVDIPHNQLSGPWRSLIFEHFKTIARKFGKKNCIVVVMFKK